MSKCSTEIATRISLNIFSSRWKYRSLRCKKFSDFNVARIEVDKPGIGQTSTLGSHVLNISFPKEQINIVECSCEKSDFLILTFVILFESKTLYLSDIVSVPSTFRNSRSQRSRVAISYNFLEELSPLFN